MKIEHRLALNRGTYRKAAVYAGVLAVWAAAAPAWAQFAYVPNTASRTVSVINTANNTVIATINLPETDRLPVGVAGNPSGTRVYVTNTCDGGFLGLSSCNFGDPGSVSVINTITNTVIKTIPIPSEPAGVVVSQDGARAYVVNACSATGCVGGGTPSSLHGSVSVIDTAPGSPTENTVIGNIALSDSAYPVGIAVNSGGTRLYVASIFDTALPNSGAVFVIDTAAASVTASIPLSSIPIEVVLNASGSRLYVSSFTGDVFIIDTANNTVIQSANVGGDLVGLTIKPDGTRLYAAAVTAGSVFSIDCVNDVLSSTEIPINGSPVGVAMQPDGSRVYVTDFDGGVVRVITTAANTLLVNPIAVGQEPSGLGQFIPSASAGSIAALIALLDGFHLNSDAVNSFLAKLKAVQASLTALNAAQRQDAVNKLQAFIREVNAQRGKLFTNAQADQLTQMAQQIIAALQAPPAPAVVKAPVNISPAAPGVSNLQGLVEVVENVNKKQGINNATDPKLQDAQAALAAAKAGDRQTAAAQLQAFIAATNAQKGNALNPAQANLLVRMASEIIARL